MFPVHGLEGILAQAVHLLPVHPLPQDPVHLPSLDHLGQREVENVTVRQPWVPGDGDCEDVDVERDLEKVAAILEQLVRAELIFVTNIRGEKLSCGEISAFMYDNCGEIENFSTCGEILDIF